MRKLAAFMALMMITMACLSTAFAEEQRFVLQRIPAVRRKSLSLSKLGALLLHKLGRGLSRNMKLLISQQSHSLIQFVRSVNPLSVVVRG